MKPARYRPRATIVLDAGTGSAGLDGGFEMDAQHPSAGSSYGGAPAISKKVTVPDVVAMKRDGKRITMMTAYDAAFARLVD